MSDAGAMARDEPRAPLIERISGSIAIAGGLLSLGTAALVVVSVTGRKFFNAPVNGDFEMVQMATALTIFSFLPYCQARRGNIVVDTFLSWLPRRAINVIDAIWDVTYAGMMGLIGFCMMAGVLDHYRSGQTTMLLQIIVWPALALCAALALLLACVSLVTAAGLIRRRT